MQEYFGASKKFASTAIAPYSSGYATIPLSYVTGYKGESHMLVIGFCWRFCHKKDAFREDFRKVDCMSSYFLVKRNPEKFSYICVVSSKIEPVDLIFEFELDLKRFMITETKYGYHWSECLLFSNNLIWYFNVLSSNCVISLKEV